MRVLAATLMWLLAMLAKPIGRFVDELTMSRSNSADSIHEPISSMTLSELLGVQDYREESVET